MSNQFKCDGELMKQILDKMNDLQDILSNAYQEAMSVKDSIQNDAHWEGDSQKTMLAFLDLVTQYHNDFINGDNAPVPIAIKHLSELQSHLNEFYENWNEYEELKK